MRVLLVLLAILGFSAPAAAFSDRDRTAVQNIIEQQLQAFLRRRRCDGLFLAGSLTISRCIRRFEHSWLMVKMATGIGRRTVVAKERLQLLLDDVLDRSAIAIAERRGGSGESENREKNQKDAHGKASSDVGRVRI